MIKISHVGDDDWMVTVQEAVVTHHRVRATKADAARFSEGAALERLLEESFRFLLEREPNTSIMTSFSLPLIGRYFPEFEEEIRARLRQERKPLGH